MILGLPPHHFMHSAHAATWVLLTRCVCSWEDGLGEQAHMESPCGTCCLQSI